MTQSRARCSYPIHGDWPPKASFRVEHRGKCRVETEVCGRHLPMAVRALHQGCGHPGHPPHRPGVLHVQPIK